MNLSCIKYASTTTTMTAFPNLLIVVLLVATQQLRVAVVQAQFCLGSDRVACCDGGRGGAVKFCRGGEDVCTTQLGAFIQLLTNGGTCGTCATGLPEYSLDYWTEALVDCYSDLPYTNYLCSFGTREGDINASFAAAQADQSKVTRQMESRFCQAAAQYDVPVAVIKAMASRESGMGSALGGAVGCPEGYGGPDCNSFGLLGVDNTKHTPVGTSDPTSLEHIMQAVQIYADFRPQVAAKHPSWANKYVLKGGAVAYDSSLWNVQTISRMDIGTENDDYGSDVMARAYWFLSNTADCDGECFEPQCEINNPYPASSDMTTWTDRTKFMIDNIERCFPRVFVRGAESRSGTSGMT